MNVSAAFLTTGQIEAGLEMDELPAEDLLVLRANGAVVAHFTCFADRDSVQQAIQEQDLAAPRTPVASRLR